MSFRWPGEAPENRTLMFEVPKDITIKEIGDNLVSENERFADFSGDDNIYAKNGRNADTLADYVCKKHGWSYQNIRSEETITIR